MSSSSRSNSGDGIVTVDLLNHPFNEPLGMLLAPGAGGGAASAASESATAAIANRSSSPTMSNVILVAGWEHDGLRRRNSSNSNKRQQQQQQQRLGPIQRSGLVRLGDRLVRINNVDVTDWTFREGMDALKELVSTTTTTTTATTMSSKKRVKLKSLGFAQVGTFEYWKNVHYTNNNHAMSPSMTQQPSSSSTSSFYNLVNSDIQHNPYLQAAVAVEQLKIIQRRRYKFISYIGQWKVFVDDNDDENKKNNVHVVKYEIKCHILFTNPPSTLTSSSNHNNIANNSTSNNSSSVLRTTTWSVYKRYSELRTLDNELRVLFGWQMNDTNNQGGVCFPSRHELETYWYKSTAALVGSGGGGIGGMYSKLGSLMPSLPRICKSSQLTTQQQRRQVPTTTATMSTSGGESGSSEHYNDDTDNPECAANAAAAAADTTTNNSDYHNSPCPIPTSFINRRQSELTTYWSALMCVEDIFDFSNLQFGLLMTKFLQVDEEILRMIKGGRGGAITSTTTAATAAATTNAKQMMLLKAKCPLFPAINEDGESGIDINIETTTTSPEDDNVPPPLSVPYYASTTDQQEEETSVGLISSLTFTREQSGNIMIDDDVSALSDGTGAAIIKKSDVDDLSHTPDVVPAVVAPQTTHHNDDNVASSTTLVAVVEEEGGNVRLSSSTSVTSSSVRSRGSSNSKRNVGTKPPRAKPAFQRQFL